MRAVIIFLFAVAGAFTAATRSPKVNVLVDERMEFLTVIQYLSGYPVLTQADLTYKKEIDEYFRDYRDHPAVTLYRGVYERFLGFDAAPTYLYHFSFPGFRQVSGFSEDELNHFRYQQHEDTLSLLLQQFKDFYRRTEFRRFYNDHRTFYDSLVAPIQLKIDESNIISIMEAHYGRSNKEYNVVLIPLLHDGGYGPMMEKGNGLALYALIGPRSDSKAYPLYEARTILSEYVIHEFSHSFCNPLVSSHLETLAADSCLLAPIRKRLEEQGYGTWPACLYEHFVRANEILITEKILGREKAAVLMDEMYRNGGWIYLRGLVEVMRQYQADRKTYKRIDDIMPLVVAYFHAEAGKCDVR
ncbi:MAG: DUF4932 domain-containing protein [Flavipsychrobacter sp.]|nr:DUF4932 domain-containing protein [Flavipsychrobacter sp.]